MVQQLDSPAGAEELRAAGVAGTYRMTPRNSGTSVTPRHLIPSLQIQAEHPDPAVADTSVRKIIEVYTAHLNTLQTQQGIPAGARMSVEVLVQPHAVARTGDRIRGLAGVALLAAVCGVTAALWADRLLTRRSRGASGRTGGDGASDAPALPRLPPQPLAPAVGHGRQHQRLKVGHRAGADPPAPQQRPVLTELRVAAAGRHSAANSTSSSTGTTEVRPRSYAR